MIPRFSSTGLRRCAALLAAALLFGCSKGPSRQAAPNAAASSAGSAASPTDDRPVILFLGTSLTAGLGLDPARAYPALIQERLDAQGRSYRAVNAGVSGETSTGALRRIDWLLQQRVAVLVIETGANDGLRGHDPELTRDNIQAIIDRARREQPAPKIVLAGMQAPRNYGEVYRRGFSALYPELAKKNGAALIPFLLDGVAGLPGLNQADGIHPTAEGQRRIAETVWSALEPVL